jgi:hypothetical protein
MNCGGASIEDGSRPLDQILGGPGWKDRLDPQLDPGPAALDPGAAAEKLFREILKAAGNLLT